MADTYRDAQDEIETLRQELATSEDACSSAMAEVEALRDDLAKAVRERDSPARRCAVRFEETETLRASVRYAEAERDGIRTAARHVVDVYRRGNVMGTVVAVDRLGEVLDGGT